MKGFAAVYVEYGRASYRTFSTHEEAGKYLGLGFDGCWFAPMGVVDMETGKVVSRFGCNITRRTIEDVLRYYHKAIESEKAAVIEYFREPSK